MKLDAEKVLNDPRIRSIAEEVLFSGNYDHLTAQEARLVIQLRAERLPPVESLTIADINTIFDGGSVTSAKISSGGGRIDRYPGLANMQGTE